MTKFTLLTSSRFEHDIELMNAFFIINNTSEKYRLKLLNQIYHDLSKLKDFPKLGIELNTVLQLHSDYRYLLSGNFIIFYKIHEKTNTIRIERLFNQKENYLTNLEL